MVIQDVIAKKRDGEELRREEIAYAIQAFVRGEVAEEQMAALLMAIYLRGLNERELGDLTMEMAHSGQMMDLSRLSGIPVDKHSTGGVGDKLTLVVAPLAAAAGVPVAKMSGRGLGHTGGTIDKLEAIPGLRTEIEEEAFLDQVDAIGLAIISQSSALVPADKLIYDLRNRTATVSSLPLIASSIMSKKLASGCSRILLDVTVGSGAFMKTPEEATALAEAMVAIGKQAGRKTVALLTDMHEPLGKSIGNALEISEAIAALKDEGPDDLRELALVFVAEMMELSELGRAAEQREFLLELLRNGSALAKFRSMVEAQGGDVETIDTPALLPLAKLVVPVLAEADGYVTQADALLLGEASLRLGAGRLAKSDAVDPAAGIVLNAKIGQHVQRGEPLCWLHCNRYEALDEAKQKARDAYRLSSEPPERSALLLGRVN